MALDKYNAEGQELYNQYGLLTDQENQDYAKYQDKYNMWASERDHLQSVYDNERSLDYSKYADDRNFDYGKYSDDRNLAYNDYRNTIADQQWQEEFDESVRQHNESMAESKRQHNETLAENKRQFNESMAFSKQQYEDAKKTAESSGNSAAALEHVSSMSSQELIDTMKAYNYDEDDTGLETFLDDCVASGRLTVTQAVEYFNRYCTPSARIDTTVTNYFGGTGAGGTTGNANAIK